MTSRSPRASMASRPTVSQALRLLFSGPGVTEWISPARRRLLQWSTFAGGVLVGVLAARLIGRLPDGAFDGQSVVLAVVIGIVLVALYVLHDVVLSMELIEKRQAESDLDLARQIQRRMLPATLPTVEGYAMAVHHEPARSVGGDAYDVLVLDDGQLFLTVADVSGKGAAAAMLMSGVLARTRALARTKMPLGELTTRLSAALVEETETVHFATLLIAVLDPRSGILRYVNAGNHPPVILRRDGSRVVLDEAGLPVGLLPGVTYTAGQAFLGRGDRLALMTDGVFDGDEEGNALLLETEFESLVAGAADAQTAIDAVLAEVKRRNDGEQFDDITVLVVERRA